MCLQCSEHKASSSLFFVCPWPVTSCSHDLVQLSCCVDDVYVQCCSWLCLSKGLGQMVSRDPFWPQCLCDSVHCWACWSPDISTGDVSILQLTFKSLWKLWAGKQARKFIRIDNVCKILVVLARAKPSEIFLKFVSWYEYLLHFSFSSKSGN